MGNTNFSFVMPRESFDLTTNANLVCKALHQLDIPATVSPRRDLLVQGDKVSGSAYRLVRHRAFHHGTMLIDTHLEPLKRVLSVNKVSHNQVELR